MEISIIIGSILLVALFILLIIKWTVASVKKKEIVEEISEIRQKLDFINSIQSEKLNLILEKLNDLSVRVTITEVRLEERAKPPVPITYSLPEKRKPGRPKVILEKTPS